MTDSEPLVTDLGRSDRIKAANSLWVRNTTLSELAVVSADPGWGLMDRRIEFNTYAIDHAQGLGLER